MALSTRQALDCFDSTDLIGIGMEADAIRRTLHPDEVVTYGTDEAGRPSPAGVGDVKVVEVAEIVAAAAASGRSIYETLERLAAEGVVLIADGGRQAVVALASGRATATEAAAVPFDVYLEVHRTAHRLGVGSAASMVFGCGETLDQRVAYLEAIRDLQQETGGLLSFTPVAHQPAGRAHLPAEWEEMTAVGYLKTLSIARMVLASVPSIVADCTRQPLKVVQMALRFGADDAGDIPVGAVASQRASVPGEQDLRRVIRDAGLRPVRRDVGHRICYLDS